MAEPCALVSDRRLSTWYLRVQELANYEMTELSDNICGLFIDYLSTYIGDDSTNVISFDAKTADADERAKKVNKVLHDIRYVSDLKLHLWEYIYYGSYCQRLDWDGTQRKFVKRLLQDPTKVVAKYSNNGLVGYLVPSKMGVIHEVDPLSIIMIGNPTLTLVDDMSDQKDTELTMMISEADRDDHDTIVGDIEYRGCKPLYYSIVGKVKEYLLKDQLINLLSIKDLIQPLVWAVSFDNNTPPDEAQQLTQNIENLCNKYSDVSVVIQSNFDLNALLDSINNNIKMFADYNNEATNMTALDLLKVTDRMQELRGDQDNIRGSILQACGIPESLFGGDAT